MRANLLQAGILAVVLVAAMAMPAAAEDAETYSFDCIYYGFWIDCQPVNITEAEPEPAYVEKPREEPPVIIIEEPFCEEYWSCTEWSECIDGVRVRGCTVSECVRAEDIPQTSEACEMPALPVPEPETPAEEQCSPEWHCTEWSECVSGIRVRGCTVNECVSEEDIPNTVEPCEMPEEPPYVPGISSNETGITEEPASVLEENETGTAPDMGTEGEVNETGQENGNVSCTPSERRCEGDRISVCSGSGDKWFLMQRCESGCLDGWCIRPENDTVILTAETVNETAEQEDSSGDITGMVVGSSAGLVSAIIVLVVIVSGLFYFVTRPRF